MARTRYSDLRDTFHVSRFTSNGLLMQADFFKILFDQDARRVRGHAGAPTLSNSGAPCTVGSVLTSVGRDDTKKEESGAPGGT